MFVPIERFPVAMAKDQREIFEEEQFQRKHFPQITLDFSIPMATLGNGARTIGMIITRAHRSMAAFGMPLMIPDLRLLAAVPMALRPSSVVRRFAPPSHPTTVAATSVFAFSSRFRPGEECRSEK